ncbi:TetR/AcrR family transcriptional regulator [Chloroflexota bacterium]
MNGFERGKEQKKDSIRRAALDLFGKYGFKKVSVSDIAQKAGVSPVTIYNHFGSKDELVRDVVKTQFQDMLKKYQEIIDGEASFPEKLETIIFDKSRIAGQFQGELAQTLFQNDPEMRQFVESMWQGDAVRMTIDLFEEGKREGYVSTKRSSEVLILYLQVIRDGFAANPELITNISTSLEHIRELNDIILNGMVGREEKKRTVKSSKNKQAGSIQPV